MENYSITIAESSRELTKKECVQLKTNAATKLDELAPIVIEEISGYAILNVHNPKARDNKDYVHYVIFTNSGDFYYTGSPSFFEAFKMIWDEMEGEPDWGIEVTKKPSRNYVGKDFITCNLV